MSSSKLLTTEASPLFARHFRVTHSHQPILLALSLFRTGFSSGISCTRHPRGTEVFHVLPARPYLKDKFVAHGSHVSEGLAKRVLLSARPCCFFSTSSNVYAQSPPPLWLDTGRTLLYGVPGLAWNRDKPLWGFTFLPRPESFPNVHRPHCPTK